jgi:ribosomal protein S18 acetylase RimI-like enzyme
MRAMRYLPLSSTDYARSYDLLDANFDISELPYFARAWRTRNHSASFKVMDRGVFVGFILISQTNRIEYIAVDSVYQSQSIGTALLLKAINTLCEAGVRSIWLHTADDRRLRAWYERHGFKHSYEFRSPYTKEWIGDCMVYRNRCRSSTRPL